MGLGHSTQSNLHDISKQDTNRQAKYLTEFRSKNLDLEALRQLQWNIRFLRGDPSASRDFLQDLNQIIREKKEAILSSIRQRQQKSTQLFQYAQNCYQKHQEKSRQSAEYFARTNELRRECLNLEKGSDQYQQTRREALENEYKDKQLDQQAKNLIATYFQSSQQARQHRLKAFELKVSQSHTRSKNGQDYRTYIKQTLVLLIAFLCYILGLVSNFIVSKRTQKGEVTQLTSSEQNFNNLLIFLAVVVVIAFAAFYCFLIHPLRSSKRLRKK